MTLTKKGNVDLSMSLGTPISDMGTTVKSALDALALRTYSERGFFVNSSSVTVPGSAFADPRLTVNHTLSRSDYTFGYAILWIKSDAVNLLARRQIFVVFTTDGTECVGQSTDRARVDVTIAPGQNYYITNWPQHIYTYSDDSRVSTRRYQVTSESLNQVSLERVRINGTNLEFIWHNTFILDRSIRMNYEWRVFRIKDL